MADNAYMQRLREQRANTWEQAKSLLDSAASENRDLTAEERSQYDKMNADLDQGAESIRAMEEAEKRRAEADEAIERLLSKPASGEQRQTPSKSEFQRMVDGEIRGFTAMPDKRDMLVGTDASGGYTVPTTLYGQIVEALRETSGIMGAPVTRIDTASGEPIDIPKVTAGVTASLTAEAAAITESTPTFDVLTLTPAKYAAFVQISSELKQDSAFDLESFVARSGGEDCGIKLGTALHTALEAGVAAGSITTLTSDTLISLAYSVGSRYRNSSSAGFLMNDTTIGTVRQFREGSGTGAYLWQPSLQAGTPDTLLGKPVYSDPNVDSGTGAGKDVVFFGDWSKFFVRLAGGVRFEVSDHFAFQNDLTSYRVIVRGTGGLADTNAIKAITLAA